MERWSPLVPYAHIGFLRGNRAGRQAEIAGHAELFQQDRRFASPIRFSENAADSGTLSLAQPDFNIRFHRFPGDSMFSMKIKSVVVAAFLGAMLPARSAHCEIMEILFATATLTANSSPPIPIIATLSQTRTPRGRAAFPVSSRS